MEKVLVITPTYNESGNIVKFIQSVLKSANVDHLIVDDNSPDNTAQKVIDLQAQKQFSSRVFLLKRAGKLGLGTAYIDGFKWALEKKYDYCISMDADFSHSPSDLPKLLGADNDIDVVVGSRYIPGGKIIGWDAKRYTYSFLANFVTRNLLSIKAKDASGGYRRYSSKFLKYLIKQKLTSVGYSFQAEVLFWAKNGKFKVKEVPITFEDRRVGESKIAGEATKAIKAVIKIFLQRKTVKEFIKFSVVGTVNMLLDWLVYFGIVSFFGWQTQVLKQLSKGLSFVVSASSSYTMNRIWTFRSSDSAIAIQAFKFLIVSIVGLGINNLSFYFASGTWMWKDIFALIFASGVAWLWNFFMNKRWTFRE